MFVLLGTGVAFAQNYQISGRVTDAATGEPLPFVSVIEKGTNRMTITDDSGNYRLSVAGLDAVLLFSFVGYKSLEMTVTRNVINAQLETETLLLEETVVVAYGIQRGTGSGSIGVVKSDDITKLQSASVSQALQGMSSGVQVVNNQGSPGTESTIYIRGIGSYSASTAPLYVIDGAPQQGGLNSVNPNDIESISILKDASSTALYGSRAANGVVMITTKRGRSEKPQVTFSSRWSTSTFAVPFPKQLSAEGLLEKTWEGRYLDALLGIGTVPKMNDAEAREYASKNVYPTHYSSTTFNGQTYYVAMFKNADGSHCMEPVGLDGKFKNGLVNVFADQGDWSQAFNFALRQDYDVSVSGTANGGKTRYFFSGSYMDDKGFFSIQRFERYTSRMNVSSEIKPWLELGLNWSYTHTGRDQVTSSAGVRTLRVQPPLWSPWLRNIDNTDWVRTPNGNLIPDMGVYRSVWQGYNPIGSYSMKNNPDDQSFSYGKGDNINARTYVQLNIVNGLKWRTNFAMSNGQSISQSFSSSRYTQANQLNYVRGTGDLVATAGNSASRSSRRTYTQTINNLLTYDKSFNRVHNLNVLLGQEAYIYFSEGNSSSGSGIPDKAGLYELANATRDFSASGSADNTRMMSWFSRAEYNYDDIYYLSGSVRADGSSRFHPDNRWGTFGSVAASWRLSAVSFMEGTRGWLNDLRIKASYGSTGNDNVARYAYQGTYDVSDFNYIEAYNMSRIDNPDLRWEKNIQFNAGVDFRILGKISGSFEYYHRQSKDLIFNRAVVPFFGWTGGFDQNVGAMRNTGIEFNMNAYVMNKPNFRWDLNFNFTTQKNVMTSLPDGDIYQSVWDAGIHYRITEGKSRYELWMVDWAGVDPTDGRHFFWKKIFDLDANGEIKRDDKGEPIVIDRVKTKNYQEVDVTEQRNWQGSTIPWAFGSLTNNFRYKDFDLSFMFYYSLGGKVVDLMYREGLILRGGFALADQVDDRWRPDHTDATIGRLSIADVTYANPTASQFVFDNTYVRMRNVTLGYNLPRTLSQKLGIVNARIYFSSDNLLTFGKSARRGTDPEITVTGVASDGNTVNIRGTGDPSTDERWGARKTFTGGIQFTF